jgi:16S rRNA (cytosine967-C5)-methyltransferase
MPGRRLKRAAPARAIAHEILGRVETSDAFADVLLAHRLADTPLSDADQRLATLLTYGTLAWQGRLDHHLAQLASRPVPELDAPVRVALRLGLFQLIFLERVPVYAAIDSTVSLVRQRGAAGFVNAVLRGAAREPERLTLPDAERDPIGRLAVEWSHPAWLVERWAAEMAPEPLIARLAADNQAPHTALRVNRTRTTRAALAETLAAHGVSTEPGRWSPDALVVARGGARLRTHPTYAAGDFSFQSEASQLVGLVAGAEAGMHALDACAAPGGKTTHLAECLGGRGLVVGLDPHGAGVRRLAERAHQLGLRDTVRALAGDARRPPTTRRFDLVLVDAPCSGLGTLRRHPELRWRRTAADLPRLADLQREVLQALVPLVRPGGVLVYAVCTDTPEETTAVVRDLVARVPDLAAEDPGALLPAEAAALISDGALRTRPDLHELDGFFAVRLRMRR